MALKRTFINRGKRAIALADLKPLGVYAYEYQLPAEMAARYNTTILQTGLVQIDHHGKIMRTWNIIAHNEWTADVANLDIQDMQLWKTNDMERQFCQLNQNYIRLSEADALHKRALDDVRDALGIYRHSLLHQIVNFLHKLMGHVYDKK